MKGALCNHILLVDIINFKYKGMLNLMRLYYVSLAVHVMRFIECYLHYAECDVHVCYMALYGMTKVTNARR